MFNKINFEVLIQMIIEFFTALALITGLLTGKINLFVHPKFNIFLWMSAILLLAIFAFSFLSLFRARHMVIFSKYFFILLPLLLCLSVSLKNSALASRDFYAGNLEDTTNSLKNTDEFKDRSNTGQIEVYEERKTNYTKAFGEDYVDINDKSYLKWYYDMTYRWNEFEGEKFRFLARVFKPKKSKQFVVFGRFGMICCTADLQPCGFIYNGKGYENLESGQWYWVTGKIKENNKYTYNYEKLPMIYDISLEKARKPSDEYVYLQ